MIAKRLGWILLGIVIGVSATVAPGVIAQDRAADIGPPIPIKFIGLLEQGGKRVAIFSDQSGQPIYAGEGQTVLGQYKLLKIGVESVVMSYLDGRGVQTVPMARNQQGSNMGAGVGFQARPAQAENLVPHPTISLGNGADGFFVGDPRTHTCWLAVQGRQGQGITALAPAPPEACQ